MGDVHEVVVEAVAWRQAPSDPSSLAHATLIPYPTCHPYRPIPHLLAYTIPYSHSTRLCL